VSPILIGAFALALGAILWFEGRRVPSRRRLARIVAVILVGSSLLVFTRAPVDETRLTVLTPGALPSARTRDAVWLSQFAAPSLLFSGRSPYRRLHLSGWGLLAHEWPDSLTQPVALSPSPLPRGVVSLSVPTEIGLGERLVVAGQLNLGARDSAWVVLDDPAGPRDSVRVGGASPRFRVTAWPRAATPADYRLRIHEGGSTIAIDTLGIAVRDSRPPTVLILDGSPNFESTYLKRWLAARGGRVTVRTTLSRGRYRTERVHQRGGSVDRLTGATFAEYDVVLADGAALRALAPPEQAALRQAVVNEGLGLLVTADPVVAGEGTIAPGIAAAPTTGSEELSVKPVWADIPRRSPVAIVASPAVLNPRMQPLVRDSQGRVLAALQAAGDGRIGATLLLSPSRWTLEGEGDLFAGYWQLLLGSVARDTVTRVQVGSDGPLRPNQPVTLALTIPRVQQDVAKQWPQVTVTAPDEQVDTVALARDPVDPRQWTGRYWPRSSGWHTIGLAGGRAVPFRVNGAREWTGLEAAARRRASAARAGSSLPEVTPMLSAAWWRLALFLLIVGALTFLWIEPRVPFT
jgi:hypothetical protein